MSDQALLKVLATMMASVGCLVAVAQAQEGNVKQACPHETKWTPTEEMLKQVLSDHRQWVERWDNAWGSDEWAAQNPQGRANLCNAILGGADLRGADLRGAKLIKASLLRAKLNEADLRRAELNNAFLGEAELNKADLRGAKLNNAFLSGAELNKADLRGAELNKANLFEAKLNEADLRRAKLNEANLIQAELNKADLIQAELNNATLVGAELNNAILFRAKLNEANLLVAKLNEASLGEAELNNAILRGAELNNATLSGTQLKDTQLDYAKIANAIYAPASPPPNAYVAGIEGLETVQFPKGEEIGLVQLRELLQKAGLREGERHATYAIESGKTRHALAAWRDHPGEAAEGLFRLVAFDGTTAYGLHPSRALILLVVLWALLIPAYWWAIRDHLLWPTGFAGIYRIWPKDRIEVHEGSPALESAAKVERLCVGDLAALGWSIWFSLLSAFHIGFREFSVGTWLSRVHPRQFTLEATGWVRTVSGLQSLFSLYLLAMWVLTYFGRPFQ